MKLTHFKAGTSTKAKMSCDPEDGRNRFLVNIKTTKLYPITSYYTISNKFFYCKY